MTGTNTLIEDLDFNLYHLTLFLTNETIFVVLANNIYVKNENNINNHATIFYQKFIKKRHYIFDTSCKQRYQKNPKKNSNRHLKIIYHIGYTMHLRVKLIIITL